MHEAAIAEALLKQLAQIGASHPGRRIRVTEVEVGDRSGVNVDALEFAIEAIKKQTTFDETCFDFERVRSELTCEGCGFVGPPVGPFRVCPECGEVGAGVKVSGGQELTIRRVVFNERSAKDV